MSDNSIIEFPESEPASPYRITVAIPGDLMNDVMAVSRRYGGSGVTPTEKAIRKLIVDAIARELRAQGMYGSGADMWYGSPLHRVVD